MNKKDDNKKEKRTTEEIKLKVINIMKENIDSKHQTINKIDAKVGILVGFYFLVFIEVVKILQDHWNGFLWIYVTIFSFSTYFLIKNFWLKNLKALYLNLESYIPHEGNLEYDGYIKELFKQYKEIERNIDESIQGRRDDLKTSLILFCISIGVFLIPLIFALSCHTHLHFIR